MITTDVTWLPKQRNAMRKQDTLVNNFLQGAGCKIYFTMTIKNISAQHLSHFPLYLPFILQHSATSMSMLINIIQYCDNKNTKLILDMC